MRALACLLLAVLVAGCASPSSAPRQVPDAEGLSAAEIDAFRDSASALEAGDAAAALHLVEPLLARSPWHVPSHALRQDALAALGRGDEGRTWYAAQLVGRSDDAARVLLAARVGPREGGARETAYRDAARKAPTLTWARIALAYELSRRARDEAGRAVAAADGGYEDQAAAALERADAASAEATQLASAAAAERPELAAAHGALADVLLAGRGTPRRRFADALRAAQKAADLDPASAASWARLARAKRATSDDEGAAKALRRAIETAPKDAAVAADLGRVLLDLRRDAEARDALAAATRLDPLDEPAALNHAVALFRTGALADAAAEFERAAKLAPADPRAHEGLARARAALGDRVGAADAMERYLAAGGLDRDAAKRFIEENRPAGGGP